MKYYAIPRTNDPNSPLWHNLADNVVVDLADTDPNWETWFDEHIADDETYQGCYEKIKDHIGELKRVAAITAQARALDLFNENHPRPETGF